MCGINGILNLKSESDNHQSILKMNRLLKHRGPDGEGVYTHQGVALGHTRLAIIDPSSESNQPFSINDQFFMTYNGECYNYKELKRDLERKGYHFKTQSDTEVVLNMYIEYGIDFVKKLNGIFSIAIYDKVKERVVLIRDRLGVKPLYYFKDSEQFIFSSEIKPILSQTNRFDLNTDSVAYYFSYRYVPGDETVFKNINMLPPATIMVIKPDNSYETIKYWDLNSVKIVKMKKIEAYDKFNDLFSDSVQRQTISDAPLGVFLSGGIDSAAIASEAIKSTGTLDTYTMDLNTDLDESKKAKEIANIIGASHTTFKINTNDYNLYEKALLALEEPLGDSIISPTYALAQSVSKTKKVVLSGEGADEILNGYVHHLALFNEDTLFKYIPNSLIHFGSSVFKRLPQPVIESIFPYPSKLGKSGTNKIAMHLSQYDNNFNSYNSLANLYSHDFQQNFSLNFEKNIIKEYFEGSQENFKTKISKADLMFWNTKYTLARLDKLTMAHGLEARVPFLDHRLVELMLSMPKKLIQRGTTQKIPLREFIKKKSPLSAISNRKKQAFFLPPEESFNKDQYNQWIQSLVNQESLNKDGIFHTHEILKLRDQKSKSLLENKKILNIALYVLWRKSFTNFLSEVH